MEKLVLKLVDICSPLYKKLGIDFDMMKRIIKLKLTMDKRRSNNININKKKEKEGNNMNYMFMMNSLFGLFLGLILFMPAPILISSNIYIGGILFMAIITVISDFSSVLLDIKDRNILLPRPISAKTLNAAKITHICVYLFQMILPLSAVGLIVGTIKFGVLFLVIIFIELIVMSLFIVVMAALLYSVILKFFSGEKLKDIINYFQIFLTFMLTFGYQIIMRVVDFNLKGTYICKLWHFLIPSMWFAAPLELIIGGNKSQGVILLSIIALIVPITLTVVYALYIGPTFEKNLSKMYSSEKVNENSKISKERRVRNLSNILCKNREEKESFIFTVNMISKERTLKLRVYPSIVMGIVFPLFFVLIEFKQWGSFQKSYDNAFGGYVFLSIYMSVLLLSCSASYIGNSENYKGAWIYKVLPIKNYSNIKKGSVKAALYKLTFTPYMIMCVIYLILGKASVIMDLIIVFNIIIICYCLWFRIIGSDMPFSKSYEIMEQNKNVVPTFLMFILIIVLAVIHGFILKGRIIIKLGYLIISAIVMIIIWRKLLKE